ncbi:MAG: hypothetical protein R3Y47_12125 [Lachnospiraceae bacterium]
MALKDQKGVPLTVRIKPDTYEQIKKLAVSNNLNVSEQVRAFIEKGLNIDGHKQDTDFITGIIRQELMAIYNLDDIKGVVEHQIERVVKMQMKTGKVSSSAFFLLLHTTLCMWENVSRDEANELLERIIRSGVDYMQLKDFKINDFLYDTDNLQNEVNKMINKD